MIAENLLRQIGECGYELAIEDGNCALVPKVEGAIIPRQLLGEIKRQKGKLLALCVCGECGRTCTTLQEIDVMARNYALCDRGNCQYRRDLPKERLPPIRAEERPAPVAKPKPAEDQQPTLFE